MTIRRIVRDDDGAVLSDETVAEQSLPHCYADLAHTESIDRFVVHARTGGSIEYRRASEPDIDELELSAAELLREHGVGSYYRSENAWGGES